MTTAIFTTIATLQMVCSREDHETIFKIIVRLTFVLRIFFRLFVGHTKKDQRVKKSQKLYLTPKLKFLPRVV